jgi:hypothetical protein
MDKVELSYHREKEISRRNPTATLPPVAVGALRHVIRCFHALDVKLDQSDGAMLPLSASQWRRSDARRWPCLREPLLEKNGPH